MRGGNEGRKLGRPNNFPLIFERKFIHDIFRKCLWNVKNVGLM